MDADGLGSVLAALGDFLEHRGFCSTQDLADAIGGVAMVRQSARITQPRIRDLVSSRLNVGINALL